MPAPHRPSEGRASCLLRAFEIQTPTQAQRLDEPSRGPQRDQSKYVNLIPSGLNERTIKVSPEAGEANFLIESTEVLQLLICAEARAWCIVLFSALHVSRLLSIGTQT